MLLFFGCQLPPTNKHLQALTPLPSFTLLSLDSSTLTNSTHLGRGGPIIFMYFSPDCEHCQRMTSLILHQLNNFCNSKIYMVTSEPTDETKKFVLAFHLNGLSNVLVMKDYHYSFFDAFLPHEIPFFAIYDSQQKLRRIYEGEVEMSALLRFCNKSS